MMFSVEKFGFAGSLELVEEHIDEVNVPSFGCVGICFSFGLMGQLSEHHCLILDQLSSNHAFDDDDRFDRKAPARSGEEMGVWRTEWV
ncbi:hypothetical protein WICPIJ_000426 [Wickerhamomyces pijperi]|uniref:Uncharacterized protein n=1 Tax=Wickerhamomyces pijperi TaxID=599730 RepID=A0A9P8QDJ0_WICPI|nr:hypothetical protein WICPIJ_000426 [Wickerhamomyces pijperi]